MVYKAVIPAMEPASSVFNRSGNPYCVPDSRSTGRPAGCPGMTRGGFTLIELLVVVLIIGILAAVAFPQYEKAVEKSRATQAFISGRHLAQAEEVFYLANGRYTLDWEELGETRPVLKDWNVRLDSTVWNIVISRRDSTLHYRFFMQYPNVSTPYAGRYLCVAQAEDKKAMSVCKSVGGGEEMHYRHMSGNYKAFALN